MATRRDRDESEEQETDDGYIEYIDNFYDAMGQFAPDDEDEGTHRKPIRRRKS